MIKYLRHPQHGVHIAYDDSEVKRCEANGWVVDENYGKKPEPVPPVKRRGRPKKESE